MPDGVVNVNLTDCIPGPQPSGIPANIGILKSKVMVWDNDPFWARPTQILSWQFSQACSEQIQESVTDVIFELGAAYLRPTFKHHDMFICTLNPRKNIEPTTGELGATTANTEVDFVGSQESGVGQIAQSRLPGGVIYVANGEDSFDVITREFQAADSTTGKDIFPHQVWRYEGSIVRDAYKVLIHPSEYQIPLNELESIINNEVSTPLAPITLEEINSTAKWDYIEVTDNGKLSIWPVQITKHSPNNNVHWTLQKWTPVWQGQDFFVSVKLGDKKTDDAKDDGNQTPLSMPEPYTPFLQYNLEKGTYFPGITNQAFHIPPQKAIPGSGRTQSDLDTEAKKKAREVYDWRYKTYILIEIGYLDPIHNYFIELVKGRNPRLLHLGEEWDNSSRLELGVSVDPSLPDAGFEFLKKCREISLYPNFKCDQLFNQSDFRVFVRNHLGNLVITFNGYENDPWIITRFDNDPRHINFTKQHVPMVVPSAPLRIHGGNISCAINFSPTEYTSSATVTFTDRQVETGPDNADRASDEDVYLTFSHMGNSIQYTKQRVKDVYFNDPRFLYDKVGYDCDAYSVFEKNQNKTTETRIYEEYNEQYRLYGKGWYNQTPRKIEDGSQVQRDPITLLPLSKKLVNGMSVKQKGVPSHLSIVNARNPSSDFPLTLDEAIDGHYDWKQVVAKWDVGIEFKAGSVMLSPPSGENALPIFEEGDEPKPKLFENYVTPIATSWRIVVLGGGKIFEGIIEPFDISSLVSKMSDSWSAEDFHSLSHEMQMECYIPIESTNDANPNTKDTDLLNLFNLGRKLLSLHDKSFYITVSYWWEKGVGHRYVKSNLLNRAGQDPNFNDVLIQMTGVVYGAKINRSNNKLTMSFTVKDYMSILDHQLLFNSPFFDSVQDIYAVYILGQLAGLADESLSEIGIDRRPLGYLRKLMNDGDLIKEEVFTYNGEKSRSERFDLPGTYNVVIDPKVKFQNGESYESAVKRIAQLAGKTVYFDRWGVLRLETPAALMAAFSAINQNIEFEPVFDFVSTPIVRQKNIPSNQEENDFIFDPAEHAAHLVYNMLTYQRSVEDCVNTIAVGSASNDIKLADGSRTGGFIYESYTFFDQVWNPEAEGFIGYRKPFFQTQGAFGSIEGVRKAIGTYAKMKFPPIIVSFETYGVPGLKALDIITLDGDLAYITEISHELDPSTNSWWCNLVCEWLKPKTADLGFLETIEPSTSKTE